MVYFILNKKDNLVKIGYSKQVKTRLKQLIYEHKTELEIYNVIDGDMNIEKYFHERHKAHHSNGEWFKSDILLLSDYDVCYDEHLLNNIEEDGKNQETQIRYLDTLEFKEFLKKQAIKENSSVNKVIQNALRREYKKLIL